MDDYTGYSQVLKAETGAETVYYTRGFELISRRVGQDAHYYLFDGGMSVRALTDETGSVTDTLVFDTFGNEVARTGSSDSPYGFQGEERDATGLYYLRARYMDPSTGTFTSMDTYGGRLSDPMSLHKYLFANSNPVKYCDPSGHFTLAEMELTLSLDNILMSATLICFAYCGVVGNDPSIDSGSALSGYFVSILLSLILPVMAAILLAVCSLLICMITFGVVAVLFGALAIGMSAKGDTVSAYICGQIAGEAIGALVTSLVRYAFAQMAVTKPGMKTIEELQDMLQEYVSTDTDVQSRRPTCVSVAYDTATGTPYYGCSGGFGTPNPTLQEMVPSVSYEDWNNVLNCAEMDAVNNALNDGAYTGYLEIVTITRRSGDVRNMCSNCFYSFAGNAYTPTESGFVGLSR